MTADAGRSAIDPNPGMLCPELSFSRVLVGIYEASGAFSRNKNTNPDSHSTPTIPRQPDCSGMLT